MSTCPICGNELGADQSATGTAICSCGWCDNRAGEKAEQQQQKNTIMTFAAVAAVMIMTYGHVLSWGSYSGKIPFLKIGSVTGTLSSNGYEELIQACVAMNKWGCAEQAHIDLYRKTGNIEVIARLAKLQTLLKKPVQAAASYDLYFKTGGKNPDISFFYAQVLEQNGKIDEAADMYRRSIDENPMKLSVNATSSLVHILMKQQKFADAREVVEAFHSSAENAKGYLNFEATELEKVLGPVVKHVARR